MSFSISPRRLVLAASLFVSMAPFFGSIGALGAEDTARLRDLPFPFRQVVSFSDDADELKPWHGAAIHRVFNQELGLPVTDSLWPHGSSRLSTVFLGPDRLNRTPSGVDGLPAYALLLREWHRGNIDQFHGWQEDSTYQLRNAFEPNIALSSAHTDLTLPATDSAIANDQRQNVRLFFTAEPPADLSITLADSTGRSLVYGPDQVAKGRQVQLKTGNQGVIVELIIPTEGDTLNRLALNAGMMNKVTLDAPSCAEGCGLAVTQIERDDFSRLTVLGEAPTLAAWNMRPALLTSHGGNTLAQDFGVPGKFYEVPRSPGTIFSDASLVVHRETHATDPTSHAYHADVLKTLGIDGVWSYFAADKADYFSPLKFDAQQGLRPLTSSYPGFYNVPRSNTGEFNRSSPDAFAEDVRRIVPNLPLQDRRDLYCGTRCDSAQGDALAMLVASSVDMIQNGEPVRHFWYTHFGSRGSDFNHTAAEPVTPAVQKWMEQLANLVYNFDGTVPDSKRVWSPPGSTWVRYQQMRMAIADHLTVDDANNTVTIEPWTDTVTGRTLPDPHAGSRDLHGLTVYVVDPAKTKVFIGSTELHAFTRNLPDETGRLSITLVDDNTPTPVLDHIALFEKGQISVDNGESRERDPKPNDPSGSKILTLTADETGRAEVLFRPSRLEFWNTSHIQMALRKLAVPGIKRGTAPGNVEIDFMMDDGKVVSINETDTPETELLPSSQWHLPTVPNSADWRYETLDVASLDWPDIVLRSAHWSRPPLPLGKVRSVRIALVNAKPGTVLELADLRALRPNPNGEAEDGTKLVAGRVTLDGKQGLAQIKIRATSILSGVLKTETNEDGYFFLPHRPKGDILTITARINGQACAIQQGRRIEIAKNEAELDINANNCQRLVSSAEDVFETSLMQ